MIEASEVKRQVGRPKQNEAIKKGRASWKPASALEVVDKEDGYRYRWSRKDRDNIRKKELEGWETVSGLAADKAKNIPSGRMDDSTNLTSTYEKHDCILQRIPEDIAQERDEYHNHQNARQMSGLTANLKKDLAKDGTSAHGNITISSRKGGETVIE